MKTLQLSFLLAFTILFTQHSQAQYQSLFGQNSTEWVFEWGNLFGSAQDTAYVFADTVLHGNTYKMITQSFGSGYDIALIREDTIQGHVWYRALEGQQSDYMDTIEQLLFDYSLNQGDTFPIRALSWGQVDTFAIVDSVYYDNQGRKCLVFEPMPMYLLVGGNEPFRMIEGIGSNYGILFRHLSTSFFLGQYLLCYYRDSVQMYLNDFYATCFVHDGTAVMEVEMPTVKIYPNPTQDLLFIENPININITQIQVYNNLGQKVMEMPYTTSLDISGLSQGLYHLILLDKQSIISTQLITKN